MMVQERIAFKKRANDLFDCSSTEFECKAEIKECESLHAWSGEPLPLSEGTIKLLPTFSTSPAESKRNALFGIVVGDIKRILPLLDDLASACMSPDTDFMPFVILFANSNSNVEDILKTELAKRSIRGFVLGRSSSVVTSILKQSHDVGTTFLEDRLPIALSRTVLQVFIFSIVQCLEEINAVVILDDDKRLPFGWSPFILPFDDSDSDSKLIFIGRDLRTPPNPSIFSLRTNLIDFLYQMDLLHSPAKGNIEKFCYSHNSHILKEDWYYDLSSARHDHLEMPVYKRRQDTTDENVLSFVEQQLNAFLRGTPLVRCPLKINFHRHACALELILHCSIHFFVSAEM